MNSASPFPRNYAGDVTLCRSHNARMGKKSSKPAANHLRAWREFRRLSQDQLAEMVNTKGNVIGLLESGERGLSDKWLRKLAPALGTRPGFLLEFSPYEVDPGFLMEMIETPKEAQPRAAEMLRLLRDAG
jgi:transcriptional regulator with XRE-family HTH domain